MKFENPAWFFLFFLIPALAVLLFQARRRRYRALKKFGNVGLLTKLSSAAFGFKRYYQKYTLFLLALSFLILALARPQWGAKMQTIKRKGLDLLIALDTSQSMLAEDIKPNRIERAKYEVGHFIDKLQGDRIGIICFAGTSFVQCPLTLDYAAAKIFLKAIDTHIIPKGGTAIGEAIHKARSTFIKEERKHKVLILLTDGEDHQSNPLEAATEAAREGIRIYTIGLGSAIGEPIPLKDEHDFHAGYLKDRQGNIVMSKLDQTTLEQIASLADGKYYHASTGEMELDKVFQEIAFMEKKELHSKKYVQYEERFHYFLLPALFLLFLEFFLGDLSRGKKQREVHFD
ncbi:MAG: vWA domain-containing protein [bacterium]